MSETYKYSELTKSIIGCAIEVNKALGPGLLESAYRKCLKYELELIGLDVIEEVGLPIVYKEVKLDHGYRIDLLVENVIVLELKVVDSLTDVHQAQVLTYLKLGNYPIGSLLNFNVTRMMEGVKRYVL